MWSWTRELDRATMLATARGHYHWTLFIILCSLAGVPTAFLTFSQVFIAATPTHWCSPPPELISLNLTSEQLKEVTIPRDAKGENFQQCFMYDINIITLKKQFPELIQDVAEYHIDKGMLKVFQVQQFSLEKDGMKTDIDEVAMRIRNGSWDVVPCKYGWIYDRSQYHKTLVTEMNLVCDNSWWPSTSNSLFWIGSVCGNIIFGLLSDRWGRRPTILMMLSLEVPLTIVCSFVADYPTYTVLRVFGGFFFPALYQIPLILALELMPPKSRTYTGIAIGMLFATGMCLLSLLAYLLRDWFSLSLAISVPFVVLYGYYWIIPESPRWLIGKGRIDEAEEVLRKLAKANGIKLEVGFLYKIHEEIKKEEIEPTPIVPEIKLNGKALAFLDATQKEEAYSEDIRISNMQTFKADDDNDKAKSPNLERALAFEVADIVNKKSRLKTSDTSIDNNDANNIIETRIVKLDGSLNKKSDDVNKALESDITEESQLNVEQKSTQTDLGLVRVSKNYDSDQYSITEEKVSILDILKYPNIRRKFIILTFDWIANGIVYNGLSYNTPHLGVNEYFAFFIGGAVEMPSYYIAWKLMDKYGRRWVQCVTLTIGGIALMCSVFATSDSYWLLVTLAMIGKLCVAASFAVFYVFVGELLPTVLRAQAMGAASFIAGLTFLVCPYIVRLADYSKSLPLLILGALSICGGGASLLLPETLNQPLPQTLQDGEMFGGDRAECCPYCFRQKTSL